jgi:hypothetical protein
MVAASRYPDDGRKLYEPCCNFRLRGDQRYNPRFPEPEVRPIDGASRITGVMRPDSPEGVKVEPALPEIPFRFIVPANADYTAINFEVWRRLQSGETLWDLNFAPLPPSVAQRAPYWD